MGHEMLDMVLTDMAALNASEDVVYELEEQLAQETALTQEARDEATVLRAQLAEKEVECEKLRAEAANRGTQTNGPFGGDEVFVLRAQLAEQQAQGEKLRTEAARACAQLHEWAQNIQRRFAEKDMHQ